MYQLSPNDLSILLVEGSKTQARIITNALNKEGISEVTSASTIAEANEIMEKHPRDLVISAMHLEDGNAIELVHELRENERLSDTPFMLVTSDRKKENLERFKQAGVVALLPKPFTREHLGRAINSTLDLLSVDEMQLEYFDIQQVRVLLVDDSKMARKHIARVLNNLGMQQIKEAVDGQEAISLLKDNMFDLVVTDYNMPEVDGRELTRYIREESEQSHLPILMVTSESNESHLANVEQEGVNALCDKPFEPQFVKKLLFQLLEQ